MMAQVLDLFGKGLADRIEAQDQARLAEMARAWAYYRGDAPAQLRVKPGDYDDNVGFDYPRLIVDVSTGALFGNNTTFDAGDEHRQLVVDSAWGTDEQAQANLLRLGTNGGVCGHAFVKLQMQPTNQVRVVVLDPSNVDVDWASDDYTKVRRYTIEWTGFDESLGKPVHYRQSIWLLDPEGDGPWGIRDEVSVGSGDWRITNETVWEFPFAPIVDCQNLPVANEYYGAADLNKPVMDLVDRIHMAASNIQKILRYHAHPKVFVYGYSGRDIDMSVDKVINFPSTDTQVGTLTMQTDLGAAFNMFDRMVSELLRMTRTPVAALGDPAVASAAASGLALKLAFMPLVAKTETKRRMYGELLNEVNQRVQAVNQMEPGEVEIVWPPVTPDDPMAEAQTALLQKQLGVAQDTLIAQLGFDPEVEAQKREDEAQASQEALDRQMASGALGDATGAQNRRGEMMRRAQDMGQAGNEGR